MEYLNENYPKKKKEYRNVIWGEVPVSKGKKSKSKNEEW